jgi:hypothetical protein
VKQADTRSEFLEEARRVAAAEENCDGARCRAEQRLADGALSPRTRHAGTGMATSVVASVGALAGAVSLLREGAFTAR